MTVMTNATLLALQQLDTVQKIVLQLMQLCKQLSQKVHEAKEELGLMSVWTRNVTGQRGKRTHVDVRGAIEERKGNGREMEGL